MRWGRTSCPLTSLRSFGQLATSSPALGRLLDAVQIVSALLKHGPDYLIAIREALEHWMEQHTLAGLNDMRGSKVARTGRSAVADAGDGLNFPSAIAFGSCPIRAK